ncbi:MAG TPA: 3-phosphoserine/phosphohydroxythreonine transaminase [Gammaproteobacteria bacterium]|nr:3-phosphoserine/phosphohydroxythreonine transaminase [Gammaproteobacteria bacterium]
MARVYNFSAGPAALPTEVLEQVRDELLDWHGSGMSVMEMSHRGKEFVGIAEQAEQDLRDLLKVPDSHRILFLQGGATGQFAAVPLNLLGDREAADYINTGNWSKKAIAEGKRYCEVNVAATAEADGFTRVPAPDTWKLNPRAAYLHYTPNETIGGVEFHWTPDSGDVPLVADMSSTILSRPVDVARHGVIYAGAQKNIGPSGLTVVIVREDLLDRADPRTPGVLDWKRNAEGNSMMNTPPTFAWYVAGLVFQWLKKQGGLEAMAEVNKRKADKLYRVIDESDFYRNPVEKESRSRMNIPFILADDSLNAAFLSEADEAGLKTLKGHRSVGGMRASLYNAVSEQAVDALIDLMHDFERRHG